MTERLQRSVEELPLLPEEWRDATTYSDWVVKLTPRQARAVIEQLIDDHAGDRRGGRTTTPRRSCSSSTRFPYPGKVGPRRSPR